MSNILEVIDEPYRILAYDADSTELSEIKKQFSQAGYEAICSANPEEIEEQLQQADQFDAVLFDSDAQQQQPGFTLAKVESMLATRDVPIVVQSTEQPSADLIQPGLHGFRQFLQKPLASTELLSSINNAAALARRNRLLNRTVDNSQVALQLMDQGCFKIRTMSDAQTLAHFVAQAFPEPSNAVIGISELLQNAIEHGNLGITYEEKKQLLLEGKLLAELDRRALLPENRDKVAYMVLDRIGQDEVRLTISDQGRGFEWRRYMTIDPERMYDPNGRGIAIARMMSFDHMEYNEAGNMVIASVRL